MVIEPRHPELELITHPTYNQIHDACVRFVNHYQAMYSKPGVVVGLSRGGLLPATIISHCLGVQMKPIEYSSTHGQGDDKNHDNELPQFPDTIGNILVVDDICDSGHTLSEVVNTYHKQGYTVHDFVLYYKKRTFPIHRPMSCWLVIPEDAPWIIFPYEVTTGTYNV